MTQNLETADTPKAPAHRPPLPEHVRRRHIIMIRCNDHEYARLRDRAARARLTIPAYLRKA